MYIENDVKLDYSDVLLRPKRSTLESRNQVELKRSFSFPHSKRKLEVVPIIAANMDGVGTRSMAIALAKQSMLTALNKSYTTEDLNIFFSESRKGGAMSQLSETLILTIGLQGGLQKVKDMR
ncbi:MAG TPA: GMP reductase, partial [Balneola sp.]|nr:GMP reductase [Balneola sp.]